MIKIRNTLEWENQKSNSSMRAINEKQKIEMRNFSTASIFHGELRHHSPLTGVVNPSRSFYGKQRELELRAFARRSGSTRNPATNYLRTSVYPFGKLLPATAEIWTHRQSHLLLYFADIDKTTI